MADKGVIFSAPMVRALLDGRKTQTRRLCAWANNPMSPALTYIVACDEPGWFGDEEGEVQFKVPYAPGDRLYVRESIYLPPKVVTERDMREGADTWPKVIYAEDDREGGRDMMERCKWRSMPSIHCPRWASRLTLTVTDVRVQRLGHMTESDAMEEGVYCERKEGWTATGESWWASPKIAFHQLWNSLHTKPGERWDDNPWIVAVSFTVDPRNIDQVAG